jgi:phosphatidylglycerophosphatase A
VADATHRLRNSQTTSQAQKEPFEFVRFDQAKPGILKELPPLTNDANGALVAGASSNIYTRATRNLKK